MADIKMVGNRRKEPILKEVGPHDRFQVVKASTSLPEVAKIFSERPDDTLLVYETDEAVFHGSFYLYDFHRVYANPPKKLKGKIHKSTIGDVMNTNLTAIEWTANISQAWALASTKKPNAILLVDDKGRFCGCLSNRALADAMEECGIAHAQAR
jgi:CBS domain-containing protein